MGEPPADAPKRAWRAWARAILAGLPAAPEAVVAGLAAFLAARPPGLVLAYRAFGHEAPLDALAELVSDRPWATTRTSPDGTLSLHAWSLATGRHASGFAEPPAGAAELDPASVSVALVPGLAFDRAGGRLGRGGGHYDRLLPRLPAHAPVVGVTRDALVVARLPRDPWDAPVTHLATESGVREAGSRWTP